MLGRPLALFVEDYEDLIYVAELAFAHAGIDVVTARSGGEALKLAQEMSATGATVDCALIDLFLPDMDGRELVQPLRRVLGLRPRLAAYTVQASPSDRARSLEAGFDFHFIKPHPIEALTTWVHAAAARER